MPSISSLPLLFRAHVLKSASAWVALDAKRSSPRRFTEAMAAISNAQSKLARRVSQQTEWTPRLQERFLKLADLRSRLYTETTPVQRAAALETVLTNVRNLQLFNSPGARLMEEQCNADQVILRRRDALATSFWNGEMDQRDVFEQQLAHVVELECGYVSVGYPKEQIIHGIFSHLQRARPQAPTVNPQSRILAQFQRQLLDASAPLRLPEANASDA